MPLPFSFPRPGVVPPAVVIDCNRVPLTDLDAGQPDGYYIDYNQCPAHLELTGSYCARVSTNEIHSLVVATWYCSIIN
jgi:hypothetical protein